MEDKAKNPTIDLTLVTAFEAAIETVEDIMEVAKVNNWKWLPFEYVDTRLKRIRNHLRTPTPKTLPTSEEMSALEELEAILNSPDSQI